jgi:hypothetical protein
MATAISSLKAQLKDLPLRAMFASPPAFLSAAFVPYQHLKIVFCKVLAAG